MTLILLPLAAAQARNKGKGKVHVQEQGERAAVANASAVINSQSELITEDGNRTRTGVAAHRILSPVCLPIPPPRHKINSWTGRLFLLDGGQSIKLSSQVAH